MPGDDALLADALRAFRARRIEPAWDRLDVPDEARDRALWGGLVELGVTTFTLPEDDGGVALDAASQVAILRALGAAAPALGVELVSHVTVLALVVEAGGGRLPAGLPADARYALVGSPLDGVPASGHRVDGHSLVGAERVALGHADWLVVPARAVGGLALCVVDARDPGVRFAAGTSSHGLRLVPCGELALAVTPAHVLPWPSSGLAARRADGLVAALLTGIADELADRAMRYALDRYQGGKMIHEHDAVRQLVGPIELLRRPLAALALATLVEPAAGDGGASAFAVERVRQAALDAIQTFGGYGYMEDFRVERYLRDANTLETAWIHAAGRQREIARRCFADLAGSTPGGTR